MKKNRSEVEENGNEIGISRRSFIVGAGVLGTGAAVSLVGCGTSSGDSLSSDAGATSPVQSEVVDVWALEEVGEPTETITAELVIIGGGGTGLAAAVQSAELGLKPLVVEKLGACGGSFVGVEYINAVGGKYQREAGVEDSVQEIMKDHLTYHHWITSKELVESFYPNAAPTVEWLESYGVKFDGAGGGKMRAVLFAHEGQEMRGAHYVEVMGNNAEKMGVEAFFNTCARKILVEDGTVTGVIVEGEDGTITKIETPVVLIATGGYSNNADFLNAVSFNHNENIQALGMDCRHADGIKMAADAGAQMAEAMGTIQWCGPAVKGAITASWQNDAYAAGIQPTLFVNQNAERFVREDLFRENFTFGGICLRNQKKAYSIFTETDMKNWEENGVYRAVFGFAPLGKPLTEAREVLVASEGCHVVDSIDEAAEAVGLDPATLTATVERYNELCAAAVAADPDDVTADADMGKKAQYMHPVSEGPYYICEVNNGFFATHGGMKVNAKMEVLDLEDNAIHGLYAGGNDAGGIQGDTYDVMYAGGSTSGWAVNTGRNAAKAINEYLNA